MSPGKGLGWAVVNRTPFIAAPSIWPRATLFLLAGVLALMLAAGRPSESAGAGCANAKAQPQSVSLAKMRKAITCLITRKRAADGKPALRSDPALRTIAKQHNDYMLANECSQHDCPGEPTTEQRFAASGYHAGATSYATGENIGYATTPAAMMRWWMNSPGHRKNILGTDEPFEDIGVAVGWGCPDDPEIGPCDDALFATYTTDFGWRNP